MRVNVRGKAPLPLAPTQALPGSPEKVAVLEERFRLGQTLWHPLDAAFDPSAVTSIDEFVDDLLGGACA